MPTRSVRRILALLALLVFTVPTAVSEAFVTFESGQVRPLAMSPDGSRLFATNTPDGRLEIFDLTSGSPVHTDSVPVGLEPVAVAARTDGEVWVVNHLSDSVSIVDVASTPPRVTGTLLVGDEPRDIVFAGPGGRGPSSPPRTAGRTAAFRSPISPLPASDAPTCGCSSRTAWTRS